MTPSSLYDPPDPPLSAVRPSLLRMRRRRRRTLLLGLVLLLLVAAGVALARPGRQASTPSATGQARLADGTAELAGPAWPKVGSGSFAVAAGESPVHGAGGPLRRYRVAVEQGAGQDAATFAAAVDEVLADPRSWIASGELRVQRVAEEDVADLTIYLATPQTSEGMCAEGGLSTDGYTSCQLPGEVIINLARWMEAVPDYGAPLAVYRAYVINHEVGHEFGEEHQACPGPGEPAPVMQQQTYGLDGCAANGWPYVDGSRYEGALTAGT